ncbi:bifunctional aspartate kinase/homoserine dehydrogenase I [Arenimonas sp. MALMAid1274]|uniref:bifunctional aspartate kinase/homoserine dehydrogenase I n=1 Tax=Arenimonas sp. MALMAid1274 TaxID=3411630 RepID=UPI003BA3C159
MNASLSESLPAPLAPPRLRAHKFGGSSLADADRIRHVAKLMLQAEEPAQVVVVSAMQGVTDALIALANAAAGGGDWRAAWSALAKRHHDTAAALTGNDDGGLAAWLVAEFEQLAALLQAVAVLATPGGPTLERIQGLGEVWSARLLGAHLRGLGADVAVLDAREVLVVAHGELGVTVDWARSATALRDWRARHPSPRVVATGFVAGGADGRPTVLGRNGSDYSGAIFAALFEADELHIWTDVDGVLSADPRLVPEAVPLPALSYREACELAYFGAKVIHPQTLTPAIARNMPVWIRNTFRPERPGTRIGAEGDAGGPVKGLTLSPGLALVSLEGAGLIGVPGTAERVFAALHAARISVVMISQGSSEHSICCVVREQDAVAAESALSHAFAREAAAGQVQGVQRVDGISVLAAVGDGMAGTPGVAAQLLSALARARVNIRAIAQGASERNISVAVAAADATRALRAAHASFWLSPQTVALAVIGPGKVGAALLDQLQSAMPRLQRDAGLDLRLRALADSRRLWRAEHGAPGQWRDHLAEAGEGDLDALAPHLLDAHLPHAVIIDCSASDAVAARYPAWLAAGIHVITPNKHAAAGDWARRQAIEAARLAGGSRFRYEATVGAGLPVIQTLRDLLDTGDELIAVEGILSGTLAWLFNRYDGSHPFSALVREAHALGYTEPDPRDDLSGVDVARKLVILAREAGIGLSLADVAVESLVPTALAGGDRERFLASLHQLDAPMAARLAGARQRGAVLRYVARLGHDRRAGVALAELPADHAFAHLRLTDNIVQFTTRRYRDNPLIVQGPGAGPEVTAAGVFSDLLRLAASLGARL